MPKSGKPSQTSFLQNFEAQRWFRNTELNRALDREVLNAQKPFFETSER